MPTEFSGEKYPKYEKKGFWEKQDRPSNLLSIGQIAKLCGISTKTLRHYDKIGIFKPEYTDSETGYRYYRKEQLFWLVMIKRLKYRSFSLEEISIFMNSKSLKQTEQLFSEKENEIEKKISELQIAKKLLHDKLEFFRQISELEKNNILNKEIFTVKSLPSRPVIFFRKKEFFTIENLSERLSRIQVIREEQKINITGLGMAIFHEDYSLSIDHEIDFEIASEIESFSGKEKSFIRTIPEGRYVCFYHRGGREDSIEMYKKMLAWLKENEYQKDGPLIKIYLLSFAHTKSRENIVSEFQIKIK